MKIKYKTAKCEVEVEGGDVKDCFAELSNAIEVFSNGCCGSCDSTNTIPVVREQSGNVFYEMRCIDCGAALGFGQTRQGNKLFPKKKKDGQFLPNNGWVKWSSASQVSEVETF